MLNGKPARTGTVQSLDWVRLLAVFAPVARKRRLYQGSGHFLGLNYVVANRIAILLFTIWRIEAVTRQGVNQLHNGQKSVWRRAAGNMIIRCCC